MHAIFCRGHYVDFASDGFTPRFNTQVFPSGGDTERFHVEALCAPVPFLHFRAGFLSGQASPGSITQFISCCDSQCIHFKAYDHGHSRQPDLQPNSIAWWTKRYPAVTRHTCTHDTWGSSERYPSHNSCTFVHVPGWSSSVHHSSDEQQSVSFEQCPSLTAHGHRNRHSPCHPKANPHVSPGALQGQPSRCTQAIHHGGRKSWKSWPQPCCPGFPRGWSLWGDFRDPPTSGQYGPKDQCGGDLSPLGQAQEGCPTATSKSQARRFNLGPETHWTCGCQGEGVQHGKCFKPKDHTAASPGVSTLWGPPSDYSSFSWQPSSSVPCCGLSSSHPPCLANAASHGGVDHATSANGLSHCLGL